MIYLVFPSSWHPSQPYLSLPALKGFLHQHGIHDVVQRDLAIELLDHLCTWEKTRPLYDKILRDLNQLGSKPFHTDFEKEKFAKLREAEEIIPALSDQIDGAKTVLRTEEFYQIDRYMEALKIIDVWLDNILASYYPSQLTVIGSQLRYSPYSTHDILESFKHPEENFFYDLYQQHYVPEILKEDVDILGVSITSVEQIIPGLTLAHLIKQARPEIHITVGGSVFTKLVDVLEKGSPLFEFVDSFIVHEGETPLLKLVQHLRGDGDLSQVPNLLYRQNGEVKVNRPFAKEELNALPTPDFDGMPFDLYLSPERVLPIMGSRGCYWERCAFCSIPFDHMDFHVRYAETVVQDFKKLKERYNCKYFFFTDEALPINFMKTFAEKLIEENVDIQWTGELKFEKSLLRDNRMETIYKSGCRKLIFGLESYNQRVLDAMKKGCPKEVIDGTVEQCIRIGIGMHFYILVGFPTETREEVMDSVNFVMDNRAILDSPGFSCIASQFDLEKGTPIAKNPEEYKVYNLSNPAHHDLALGYSYDVREGLNAEQATEVYQEVVQKISREVMTFPHNYSLSDGLLYLGYHDRDVIQERLAALSP
ncbi:MAG: radical SAM protein [Nitrospinaceae bacterium]|nr:radical SAM protein [Nitrospinaceae bacterium]NIR57462.1 radical SAM protein [Nitrospinaceae bacterium]NIS87929.1 radical SAM protein [Nitrospinaceae bacterium]NIT84797.1 radical SAM protein [Nitrospinaceae bacterium]NIU46973.1 radical SAM protein [Nitrospinaceae bacterium]